MGVGSAIGYLTALLITVLFGINFFVNRTKRA
jgi:hypothetical protein